MTEELDIFAAFRQPRNIGAIAEALQPTTLQLNHDSMTVPHLPPALDWTAHDELYETLDELEEEGEEDTIDIMDSVAWAYLPEGMKDDLCYKFYHGIREEYTVLLTIPNDNNGRPSITAVQAKIRKDAINVWLTLNDETIAWHTYTDGLVTDKYHPIFFDYSYEISGRFLLGAAQLIWSALGHQVYIEDASYIVDSDGTVQHMTDEELANYRYNKIVPFGQLSGDFGLFKKKVRNGRRRRNLY